MLTEKYSFDTSVFINAWNRDYPRAVFKSFWLQLESDIVDGKIVATDEVRIELERKDDEILKWAKERSYMFIPIDVSIQNSVLSILRRFPRLVEKRLGISGADPFVVGLAMIRDLTVVTYEKPSGNPEKPKIPDACAAYGIECISLPQMALREGWVF